VEALVGRMRPIGAEPESVEPLLPRKNSTPTKCDAGDFRVPTEIGRACCSFPKTRIPFLLWVSDPGSYPPPHVRASRF
jgi:hypothetical protein